MMITKNYMESANEMIPNTAISLPISVLKQMLHY